MLILQMGEDFPTPCALLMGGFDGLHRGHAKLLHRAKETKLPVGITSLFALKGGSLFTRTEREFVFGRAGLDFVLEMDFGAVKDIPAKTFLQELFAKIPAKAVFCGEDFRFGRGALGTPSMLNGAERTVAVEELVTEGGEKISASRCKALLLSGDMRGLNDLLVHPYFMQGSVEHGRQVGRTYGFPTLNLSITPEKLLPKDGVYGGVAETPKGTYKTIVNVGARPTFGVEERKIEAYLDGFSGDLYGETVRIYPTEFYRGIEAFADAAALKEQLERDIQRLRGTL